MISEHTKVVLNAFYIPFIAFMNFLKLDHVVLEMFALLLIIDMFTGIAKSIRLGIKPTSKRFSVGILSKLTLILIPIILSIAAKAINVNISVIVYTAINALILNEVYSSIANIYTIRTGKVAEEFDVLSKLLSVIKNFINRMLDDKNIS